MKSGKVISAAGTDEIHVIDLTWPVDGSGAVLAEDDKRFLFEDDGILKSFRAGTGPILGGEEQRVVTIISGDGIDSKDVGVRRPRPRVRESLARGEPLEILLGQVLAQDELILPLQIGQGRGVRAGPTNRAV